MMFRLPTSSLTVRAGYMTASSSASGSISPRHSANSPSARESSPSTRSRSFAFSRIRSTNLRIISSRLSFKSLCPRTAVLSRRFNRVSSILVGLTFKSAI